MIRDPYIGMPIAIDEEPREPGCSAAACGLGSAAACGRSGEGAELGSLPLAMCYVPYQRWQGVYSPQEALARGTAFPELDLPFTGGMRR